MSKEKTIKKRIIINPASKGNIGKSMSMCFLTAWCDYFKIPWLGFDFDDRHSNFSKRYPEKVEFLEFNTKSYKKAFFSIMETIENNQDTDLFFIDAKAQGDLLILKAIEESQLFSVGEEFGLRFTFLLTPTDDDTSMKNFSYMLRAPQYKADIVIIKNPYCVKNTKYDTSSILKKHVEEINAHVVEIPAFNDETKRLFDELEKESATEGVTLTAFVEYCLKKKSLKLATNSGDAKHCLFEAFRQFNQRPEIILTPTLYKKFWQPGHEAFIKENSEIKSEILPVSKDLMAY